MKRKTNEEWITQAKNVHGEKYDYTKTEYKNARNKVLIVCQKHGEFWQRPNDHLKGCGCPKCNHKLGGIKHNSISRQKFIEKARNVHGDKYDYSKVEYIDARTKICIICSKHGEFWQKPNSHLNGQGCPICCGKKKMSNETFIEKAKKVHGEKYDYSKVEYINNKTKVCIICPQHGEFWQTPNSHLNGQECPKCAWINRWDKRGRVTTEEFIEKAKKVHGEKYDYSKVEYINSQTKVCIICPEHGEFWQKPNDHLNGQGCQKCNRFLKTETKIYTYIKNSFPDAIHHYRNHKMLGRLEVDIFIPSKKCGIEVQGVQHFKPNKFFGGYETYIRNCENDIKKYNICKENGIKIFYYTNIKSYPKTYIDEISTDIDVIKDKINEQ